MTTPPNRPHVARKAKRARKAGTVEDVRVKLWNALLRVETVLLDTDDAAVVLRAAHAMTQGAAAYARITEAGELEARLCELEAAVATRGAAAPLSVARAA